MVIRLCFALALMLLPITACTPSPPEMTPTNASTNTITPSATITITATHSPEPTATVTSTSTPEPSFSFTVTSDISHYSTPEYFNYPNFFAALLGYVKQFGPGDFMVTTGDVLPAADARWTIDQVLDENYLWFPLPGNHDFGKTDLSFLQNYNYDPNGSADPNIVHWGPEPCPQTTYSFDYQNAHFVALNVYCNAEAPWGIDGSISDTIYNWLAADLAETTQEHIFVFGHEPAFPQPDAQTGDIRHLYESLDQYSKARDRFWELLRNHNVLAYVHGHTHGYSAVKIEDVWQIDAGQAMGVRAAPSPGTFLIFSVHGGSVSMEVYRGEEGPGFAFLLRDEINLRQ
ncbi:MAG: metallophosphoesterase [Chloroflexota bacterium]|nr:metallophosphoesterase [Chloroflexota bacterium]